jgi:hypothetical protein
MKCKSLFIIFISASFIWGCRSNNENCIDSLMDKKGYSYSDAKDACEDAQIDSNAR